MVNIFSIITLPDVPSQLCILLSNNFADSDIVVHAAGPFQQSDNCKVLEAAIGTKVRER